jgi:hypothetical protein
MPHAGGSMYIHSSQQHHPLNQQIFKTSVDGLRTLPPTRHTGILVLQYSTSKPPPSPPIHIQK